MCGLRKTIVTLFGVVVLTLLLSFTVSADTGFVTASKLNIRKEPSTTSQIIGKLVQGDIVDVVDTTSSVWVKVRVGDRYGYLSRTYLNIRKDGQVASRSGVREVSAKNSVIEYAKKFLGKKYVMGGNGPNVFDCSGFVKYVYSNFGVNLSRTTYTQVKEGVFVSKQNLREGDLVFFGSKSNVNHVGIYISNGNFIHASSPGDVVKISSLNSGYYLENYHSARRVK
jgi:N-acetylmuramoyl-L-alanine amidase